MFDRKQRDMNGSFPARPARRRRAASVIVALVAGLLGGLMTGAQAQNPNDTLLVPTPYSWPAFHAGGTSPGMLTPTGLNPNPNLLAAQLQGTPTGYLNGTNFNGATLNGSIDQIASYLLGNYFPAVPPALITTLDPNNFRDAAPFNILEIFSPFVFTFPSIANTAELTVDDNNATAPNFSDTGGWSGELQDGTATNEEYVRDPVSTAGGDVASWTLPGGVTPTPLPAGFYVVTVHIPDSGGVPPNGNTGASAPTELRITDAHYVVRDINTTTNTNIVLADTHISQTEANANQYLAGPFFVNTGDTIVVSLDNSTAGTTAGHYVVADSVSLSTGFGADVQSPPAVIEATNYPEIQNALYYGVTKGTLSTPDTVPYGNQNLQQDPTVNNAADYEHRVRSLIYYGRQENIVLQDASGNLVNALGAAVTTPVVEQVGAIYCVDGQNGEVVWRYQTPYIEETNNGTVVTSNGLPVQSQPSREVFSTPVVARINVEIPKYTKGETAAPTFVHTTKLVVIVGDNNGMVYCLDAVGARDGTSNSGAVSVYNQPLFAPQAPLDAGMTFNPTGVQDTDAAGGGTKPHVGNTVAYWIYRPDPNSLKAANGGGKVDATSNLPVPGSFGTASPVIFVNPDPTISKNTVGVTSTFETDDPTLTSDATVYLGNSNGVLYALDTHGGVLSDGETYNGSLHIFDATSPNPLTGSTVTPTTEINWWLPLNGSKTSDTSDATTGGGYESIVSTPAIFAVAPPVAPVTTTSIAASRYIYVTSADDADNEGRLYAVQVSGFGAAETKPKDISGNTLTPGATDYNEKAVSLWEFPNRYVRTPVTVPGQDKIREALGSITGSPVVFTDPNNNATGNPLPRVYFAACSGLEYPDTTRPTIDETGRIWAVEAKTGKTAWAYPDALDPNVTAQTATIGGQAVSTANPPPIPLGAFRDSTPAIGMVQFPATIVQANNNLGAPTYYTHTDGVYPGGVTFSGTETTNGGTDAGPIVPMLYVGSAGDGIGQQGPRFYGLDLDGRTDAERQIFEDNDVPDNVVTPGLPSPAGSFETSPVLITNATATNPPPVTGAGNGGSLFVASGATLYQISATPITSRDPAATQPIFNPEGIVTGLGALTTPAVSGYINTDAVPGATAATAPVVREWVYFGDSGLGIMDAITPIGLGGGSDAGSLENEEPLEPAGLLSAVIPQFPLFTYIFDGSTTGATPHPATSQDMTQANQIGAALPLFEWGQDVYIRIGNVVPPNPGDTNAAYRILDPDDPTIYFTNGGPVTIQISDLDPGTGNNTPLQTDSGQVPAVVLPNLNLVGGAVPNGFVRRTDSSHNLGYFINPNERLGAAFTYTDSGGNLISVPENGWIGAYTYAIRDGSARRNTPGSTRRVVTATQVVQAYDDSSGTPVFKQSVTLQTTITTGGEYTAALGANGQPTSIKPIFPVDQPTFGILNPLAVRGGGVPLFDSTNGNVGAKQIGTDVGPFYGVKTPTGNDLAATANGNRYPSTLPVNGVTTVANRRAISYTRAVAITSVGDVSHGSTGSNADTKAGAAPTGTFNGTTGTLTDLKFGPYALDIADRSALGLVGLTLSHVEIGASTMRWIDNTGNEGPGSVVNPLPWEAVPHSAGAGANISRDYPDIASSAMNMTLQAQTINGISGNITNQPETPDPAAGLINESDSRTVYADPVQLQVSVPRYQPANLQIFDTTQGAIGPEAIASTNDEYPMGYIAQQQRVYVDSNHNGRWDPGEAYRTFATFGGVPVDMTTNIETPTIDLGKLPEGLGLQTENFPALGTFMPYLTQTQLSSIPASTQIPGYYPFYKPVTVFNRGNTNLLNVHFDQKIDFSNTLGAGPAQSLPLLGDSLDPDAEIPAADLTNLTGPRGTLPSSGVTGLPFLLRTSLDSDLLEAYGRNPGLSAPYNALGAFFHKARVGDASPSNLTVPDVPNDNDPTQAPNAAQAGNYNLLVTSQAPPVIKANGGLGQNSIASSPLVAAPPYIALAVPQGTPVGTYSQSLRLFEGVDPNGYHAVYPGKNTYVPLLPPQYNGHIINPVLNDPTGGGTRAVAASDIYSGNDLVDTWIVPNGVTTQPYSTPATVKATVTEARLTDGNAIGDLPQIDAGPTNQVNGTFTGSANFLPTAFRDPATGNVSLYWTSSRSNPYTLVGANLNFSQGYFAAADNTNWWSAINPNGITTGINTAISVAPPSGGNAYGFLVNVASGGGSATQTQLRCYPIKPATGALVQPGVPVTQNTSQPIFGAHGVTFTGAFTDAYPGSTASIPNNLWAFWYGGARGRSTIQFASAASSDVDAGTTTAFGPSAVLPIPAGLVSVSDPTAVQTFATGTAGASIPVIEVTYTGVSPDGNADIYVSRYRPYFVRDANGNIVKDANNKDVVALALQPSPLIAEQLQATDGNLWWQARDVAWNRTDQLNVFINGTSVLQNQSGTQNADGSFPLNAGIKTSYDRATGTLIYTNVTLPTTSGNPTSGSIYVDLARGRIRFSPQYATSANPSVVALFIPTARRITTDSRADTAPIAFIDGQFKQNEANFTVNGVSNGVPRALADRYWFIWRKSGTTGTSTTATLFYKTQRLTLDLNLPASAGFTEFPGLKLDNNGLPQIVVTVDGTQVYPAASGATNAAVDVDWKRGRVYFPIVFPAGTPLAGQASEGRAGSATFTLSNGTKFTSADPIYWLDEPRTNVSTSDRFIASGPTTPNPTGFSATSTGEIGIPIDTIVNESNVNAFLDPYGSETTPHKIWLFWNSTRNGTADIYYETISPLFSASAGN
jgi:hypothetical protein